MDISTSLKNVVTEKKQWSNSQGATPHCSLLDLDAVDAVAGTYQKHNPLVSCWTTGNLKVRPVNSKQWPFCKALYATLMTPVIPVSYQPRVKRLGHKYLLQDTLLSSPQQSHLLWLWDRPHRVNAGWANQLSLCGSPQGPVSTGFLQSTSQGFYPS